MRSWKTYEIRRALLSSTGLMIVLPVVILVNVIFSFVNMRWDATENKVYSLSEGSRHIVSRISEPVVIKFFWSRNDAELPRALRLYAGNVKDFLAEVERAGNGRISIKEYDTRLDSDEEDMARKYALRPFASQQGCPLYCGLVFLSGEREERIATLDPSREELLEYDIMRNIYQSQLPGKKTVGIISDLPVFGIARPGEPAVPWIFVQELKKTYEVKDLPPNTEKIDPEINILMLIHPKNLSPQLQFAIDQYVLGGGNALVFVDPYAMSEVGPMASRFGMFSAPASSAQTLFKAWGISTDPLSITVDYGQSTRMGSPSGKTDDNPLVLSLRPDTMNHKNQITSRLDSMLVGLSGALRKAADSSYEFEPLLFSSHDAALATVMQISKPVEDIRREISPAGEQLVLAAQVRGKFKTAFPDGPPKIPDPPGGPAGKQEESRQQQTAQPPADYLREGKALSTLVVVADTDLLADPFYVNSNPSQGMGGARMFNDNFNFVANACELLTGNDDLIGLRSRGKFQRPFTRVLALQRSAQEKWLSKEQELARQGEETNRKLQILQQRKDESQRQIVSAEQEAEILKFQEEKRKIDLELKEVRKQLNAEINDLGRKLRIVNIFLVPAWVILAGLGFAMFRQWRMNKR